MLFPFGFDLSDDFADRCARGESSGGGVDAFGALVALVEIAGEVSELLELAEQVVERLLAHPGLGREVDRALVLGAGVLEHVEVRGDQIGVAALVQAGEHPVAHGLERDSQERADQRRRRSGSGSRTRWRRLAAAGH